MSPLFEVGEVVRRKSAPDKVGVIRARFHSDQTADWQYKVTFGIPPARQVPETDLERLPDDVDPWQDLLDGRVEGAANYHKLLTFERLNRPPSRVAESFGVARAKLLPYQFKPLLKFLDSPAQRLLIADDVGLGKTIEAGYIFKELKAAHNIEQCLIVVPARLRFKWQRELEERFDERFEIVRASDIRTRLIGRLESGREIDPFRWITSYESVRQPDVISGLSQVPAIDLVILDEAHRVRNPETQQNAMARALSACANSLLLLTATPVQTSLENLFQLLRLIDPDNFVSYSSFDDQLKANRPVVQALAKVRARSRAALESARQDLESLSEHPLTRSLTKEPFFESLIERLHGANLDNRRELVELQRDIAELSVTSAAISRTRKVDVLPDRPERSAQSVPVPLTDGERRIYDYVATQFLNEATAASWGTTMAMIQALRLTASCIPAAIEYFQAKRKWGAAREAGDNFEFDNDSANGEDAGIVTPPPSLEHPTVDSKFMAFRRILDELWSTGQTGPKVVVFAYFIPTLYYLARRLTELGVEFRLIHGQVSMEDREERIEDFVRNPSIRILLSSEVGSEGVDLQAASVVVNYDLPWNPMVVEQRIGRIDRLGQTAKKLVIVNLVLENTVEDRVLMRLYDRVRLFEQTIGEAEEILGERVQELALGLLRQELSVEEAGKKAEQAADAFLNSQKDAEELQSKADQLMAGDQAFLDEVESIVGERKVPSPSELFRFLGKFLDSRYPGSEFPGEVLKGSVPARLHRQVGTDLLNAFPSDQAARRFAHRLQLGAVSVTMNSDAFMRVGSAEFISMHHCLVRLACHQMKRDIETLHRAFHLRVRQSTSIVPGDYVMQVIEFEVTGIRPRTELRAFAIQIGGEAPLIHDDARDLFVESLEHAGSREGRWPYPAAVIQSAISKIRGEADKERAYLAESETTLGALRAARRRATREGFVRQRLKAAADRLATLRAQHANEFAIRMTEAKVRLEQNRLDELLANSEPDATTIIAARDVAVAFVRVEG